jgi:diacylglycerol kinase (ATP)
VAGADVVFLVNPASANGSTGHRWAELARRAAELGLRGETLLSERPGHVAELARVATEEGTRLLVVVGGDGTVHEAANGILSADGDSVPELAIIPRGTGTDFVRTFGIPSRLEGAVRVALGGRVRTIDAGRARYVAWDGSPGAAYFANFAGAGISGAIARRANASSKALGGRLSFMWATLAVFARWRSALVSVDVDGEARSRPMFEVLVAIGEYAGGGMRVTPGASPDDGLLDVLLIGDVTKLDFTLTFPKIYRGRHLGHPKVELLRGRRVDVETDGPVPITLDGEQPGTTPATFEIVPSALRLRVPA